MAQPPRAKSRIAPCRPSWRNDGDAAPTTSDPEGLRHWTQVDCDQTHRQLPCEGGPAWESAVWRVILDGMIRGIISDDYRPQNDGLGKPTPLSRSGKRRDIITYSIITPMGVTRICAPS